MFLIILKYFCSQISVPPDCDDIVFTHMRELKYPEGQHRNENLQTVHSRTDPDATAIHYK